MRQIETIFQTFGASLLLIGLKGESNATEILIDCAEALEEYQGTMAAMSITGPDGTVYPGDISLDENGIVHWVVSARDCSIEGHGSARVDLVDDDGTVVASAEATTIIIKTNMQNIEPDQIADWTDAASVALQEVRAALLDMIDNNLLAEAFAKGTLNGVEVEEGDPGYNDNAKHYKELAASAAAVAGNYATAAAGSATAAAGSATAAASSASAAETSSDNALEQAAVAGAYANAAGTSMESAVASKNAAAASATAAAASATAAETERGYAEEAAMSADEYAAEAAESAEAADTHKGVAVTAASQATDSATAAAGSATAAAGSATAAAGSATAAAQSASDAQDVLDSIPQDYSALNENVAEIRSTLISKDTINKKATLVKTIENASISAVTATITSTSKSKIAIFDVLNAPKMVCNNSSNRFVTMFLDDADAADIGTVGYGAISPGNNPTISNYIIGNPQRARYLAVWYATSNIDFPGEINLINDDLVTVQGNALIANHKSDQVAFVKPTGAIRPYSGGSALIETFGNSVKVSGTITAPNLRCSVYGDAMYIVQSTPSYANVPSAYHDPIEEFVVGHDYAISMGIISGSYTTVTEDVYPYFEIRDKEGNRILLGEQNFEIMKWSCDFVPEALFFCLRAGEYMDAVFQYNIVDLNRLANVDFSTNYLSSSIRNYTVPGYFEDHLSSAITKINTAINSNKTEGTYGTDIESFIFITDVHWGNNKQHSPALIKRILESCPISTVVCGGDFVENSNTKPNAVKEIKGFTDAIAGIPCYDYFAVCGNHDANAVNQSTVSDQFTKEEEYNLIYSPFADKANVHWIWDDAPAIFSETKVKNDYYVDHARTRTRYLCIDWSHPYGTTRQTWIESVLAKNDGYRVVVVYHGIYKATNGELEPEHTALMTILEPYKSKIVAVISGHAHMDRVVDYYGDGSVPVIITSCDRFSTAAGAVENTINEQCFDVVVIDYGQSKIELVRVGRGSDRTVAFSIS